MTIRRNDKGSVLVWAVVIASVLFILIGAVLTISFSYYKRSNNNNSARQAYFTSRSVVDAVSGEIKNGTKNGLAVLNKLNKTGDFVNLNDVSFSQNSGNVGTTTAFVELSSNDTIKITAITTISNQTKTVSAVLKKGSGTATPIGGDFPGLDIPEDVKVVDNIIAINGSVQEDIYVKDFAAVVVLNNADYSNTIYAEAGAIIDISRGSKFSGNIYAESGTMFTFWKLHKKFIGNIYVKDSAVLNSNGRYYTITKSGSSIRVSPRGMDNKFKALISIYTGTETDGGWGDTYYE